MVTETLFKMRSPYRDDFRIKGFRFGGGKKCVAIVGSMRGDEIQQQFVCSQVVKMLTELEAQKKIAEDCEILVVPNANHFSMNLEKRFWALDNTDINRMFPGYGMGETTQRIAHAIFENIKGYEYGIQLASYYMSGEFIPHVRMMKTGYEDVNAALLFGMPYVYLHEVKPYDTVVLNYNWQLWGTKAFSVYAGQTSRIDNDSAAETQRAILRFLSRIGVIDYNIRDLYASSVVTDADQISVHAPAAGIMYKFKKPNDDVSKGDILAHIVDPYNGSVIAEIKAPANGTVFFVYDKPLVLERTIMFRLIK